MGVGEVVGVEDVKLGLDELEDKDVVDEDVVEDELR